jgi:putative phosphoesterase
MRVGVVSDVHGNLQALEAALDVLVADGVDRYACLGDLVGYGPRPNECVARIAELGAVCVVGNHDLVAIGRAPLERCAPLARRTLEWTREILDSASRQFLSELPVDARTDGMVLTHGALGDPWRYVHSEADAVEQLRRLAGTGVERWLLVGHTHHPLEASAGAYQLLNPGAVGQSRDRRALARFATLDVTSGEVRLHAVGYDTRGCRRDLRRAGLPADACHPTRIGAVASLIRARRRLTRSWR